MGTCDGAAVGGLIQLDDILSICLLGATASIWRFVHSAPRTTSPTTPQPPNTWRTNLRRLKNGLKDGRSPIGSLRNPKSDALQLLPPVCAAHGDLVVYRRP